MRTKRIAEEGNFYSFYFFLFIFFFLLFFVFAFKPKAGYKVYCMEKDSSGLLSNDRKLAQAGQKCIHQREECCRYDKL